MFLMVMITRANFLKLQCTLLEIEEYYQTSLCYVSSGLAADENGDIQLAVQHYVDAMQSLEKV